MSASHIVEAGECLACGHRLPFAIYRPKAGEASVGICAECARLAAPNRGPCSEKRGCGCRVNPWPGMRRHAPNDPECQCESCLSIGAEETYEPEESHD
jgi:hypothetical protein